MRLYKCNIISWLLKQPNIAIKISWISLCGSFRVGLGFNQYQSDLSLWWHHSVSWITMFFLGRPSTVRNYSKPIGTNCRDFKKWNEKDDGGTHEGNEEGNEAIQERNEEGDDGGTTERNKEA